MTIISLISDQPIPNLIFLKQMPKADRYVFLTTERMEKEGKADFLAEIAGIPPEKMDSIIVDHEDPHAVSTQWAYLEDPEGEHYHINLTGGTKMMSMGTYSHFAEQLPSNRVKMYYLPISGKEIRQVYPGREDANIEVILPIDAYLAAHGVSVIRTEPWQAREQEARRIFNHILKRHTDYRLQNRLLESRTDPEDLAITTLDAADRAFYSGQWMEVWLASKVQELLKIPAQNILVSTRLNKSGNSSQFANEYDVMYIWQNRLYMAECKYYHTEAGRTMKSFSRDLFKLGGVQNLTGLNARSFMAILGKVSTPTELLEEQCRILRMKTPALRDTLEDDHKLLPFLQRL